jgi:GT2 family glycosyltransferase
MFKVCVKSIVDTHGDVSSIVVVNDGDDIVPDGDYTVINNDTNVGVGESKNKAISHLIELGCEHLFIIEDDVMFISTHTIDRYLKLSELSGVKHFNFCLHGDANKLLDKPAPKLIVDYNDVKMALYHNVTGALSYYHSSVIEECGVMDTNYMNAMEHVDHTMRIINAGYHPPFRWFADVADSDMLIGDQDQKLTSSKIRKEADWQRNFQFGVSRFQKKYSINVCDPDEPQANKQQVIDYLRSVRK